MYRLTQNELMKIGVRLRTWIMAAIVVLIVLLIAILLRTHEQTPANWQQSLRQQNAQSEQALANPRAPIPASGRAAIKAQIAVNNYDLDHNIAPGQENAWSFTAGGLTGASIAVVFATVIAGDIVAGEFASGTIKALLTQPVGRTRILASKYLAVVITAVGMVALVFVSALLIGGLFFGFVGADLPHVFQNAQLAVTSMNTSSFTIISYALELVSAILTVTIAFMISTVFRSSALSIAISIITLFVGVTLVQFLSGYSWDKYILFANTNLMQYVSGGPIIPGMTLTFSIITLLVYFIVMLAISWRVFVGRDVAA